MKTPIKLILAAVLFIFYISSLHKVYAQNKHLKNARWFNGEMFSNTNIYIVDGTFSFEKPSKIDEVIDLKGKFIIPTLTEAHTHVFTGTYNLKSSIQDYLKSGILNVQVLGGSYKGQKEAEIILKEYPIDIKYSNGGITCTLGHPFTIYEPLAMNIHNPMEKRKRAKEISESRLAENDAYWFFDTVDDVEKKWPQLKKTDPDVIKIMLLNVKHFDSLLNYSQQLGGKGISRTVAAKVVEKAHQEGLKVFAHIETADDLRTALEIGVDHLAHIPGYAFNGISEDANQYSIEDKDINMLNSQGTSVITTSSLAINYAKEYSSGKPRIDQVRLKNIIDYQRKLISRFINNGVKVLIGSDQYGKTLLSEIEYLHKYKILDSKTILKIITEANAHAIFPNKKIGRIANGYDANFIVLEKDPLVDISLSLNNIIEVYKNGKKIKFK